MGVGGGGGGGRGSGEMAILCQGVIVALNIPMSNFDSNLFSDKGVNGIINSYQTHFNCICMLTKRIHRQTQL